LSRLPACLDKRERARRITAEMTGRARDKSVKDEAMSGAAFRVADSSA